MLNASLDDVLMHLKNVIWLEKQQLLLVNETGRLLSSLIFLLPRVFDTINFKIPQWKVEVFVGLYGRLTCLHMWMNFMLTSMIPVSLTLLYKETRASLISIKIMWSSLDSKFACARLKLTDGCTTLYLNFLKIYMFLQFPWDQWFICFLPGHVPQIYEAQRNAILCACACLLYWYCHPLSAFQYQIVLRISTLS